MRYKMHFAFDGTNYCGYQAQDNGVSVQGTIEGVLAEMFPPQSADAKPIRIAGCSRTDAGVHARDMVAAFNLPHNVPPEGLMRGMNARLPPSIKINEISFAPESFDACRDAKGKEYRYFLYNARVRPPHLAPFWDTYAKPLDLEAMREGARYFVGTQDFAPFAAASDPPKLTTVRTVVSCDVYKTGPRIVFVVRGTGFLYKQVRSMVGFLIKIGAGKEKPRAVRELLENHVPRTARVPTAAANGLCLWKVFYRKLNSAPTSCRD